MPELVHDPKEVEGPGELGDSTVLGDDAPFEAVTVCRPELQCDAHVPHDPPERRHRPPVSHPVARLGLRESGQSARR